MANLPHLLFAGIILLLEACLHSNGQVGLDEKMPEVMVPSFPTVGPNVTKKSDQDEVDILPQPYYRDVAPTVNGKPVKVTVSVVILNIKLSPGSSQTFDADIFYHNYWTDHRLQKPSNEDAIAQRINLSAHESLVQYKLSDSWRERLWTPDTFFRNAIQGKVSNVLTPTSYFTVTNYTEVFMAVRLSLKLYCEMNFAQFPFDTQTCFLNISMTSEDINTVVLEWESFRVDNRVDVTEFEVISVNQNSCVKYTDIGAIFSCLYGEIKFKRISGNYLIKRFIPSFIIVLATFTSFWIPTTVYSPRTSLPITALLALITQQIRSDLDVSYVYALQVWNMVCTLFVFANLLEFAIALYHMHMVQKRRAGQCKKKDDAPLIETSDTPNDGQMEISQGEPSNTIRNRPPIWTRYWGQFKCKIGKHFRTTSRHSSVDYISRYLFPLAFLIFLVNFICYCS